MVLNLTTGMGGDLYLGGAGHPFPPAQGTDMARDLDVRVEVEAFDTGHL